MITLVRPRSTSPFPWRYLKCMPGLQLVQLCFFVFAFSSLYSMAAPFAFATTYYVSRSGSDANNGLSPSSPWRTVAKVNASSFNPGDSIFFKRGDTWFAEPLKVSSSGSAETPITFGAYGSGERPKFDGNNTTFPNYAFGLVQVLGKSHIVIQDLEITNTVRDILVISSGAAPVTNVTVRNCVIHKINTPGWSALNAVNFTEGTVNSLAEGRMSNITIEHNVVHSSTWNNIRVNGGVVGAIIRNNTVYNTPHNGIDIKQVHSPTDRNRNIQIINNVVYNSGDTGIFLAETAQSVVDGNKLINNLRGIKTHAGTVPTLSNNIFQRNQISGSDDYALFIQGNVNAKVLNNTIYNNDKVIYDNGNTNLLRANDLQYLNRSGGNVAYNPLFVNAAGGDLRLCTGVNTPVTGCSGPSQAINAGTNVGLPFNGNAPDLGALESGLSFSPTPPTNLTVVTAEN